MRLTSLLFALLLALPAASAAAEEGTPVHIRGTVEKLEGSTLQVKSREGESVSIALAKDAAVNAVAKAALSDIKAGDFIGTAALQGTDGKLHAQEVLIFPEALRGAGEGHHPWDLTPDSTMTNATVAEVAATGANGLLTLKYKDGEKDLEVTPDAPVVTIAPGDASLLQPGTVVFVLARKMGDGSLAASAVLAGKDGVNPPM